MHNQTWHCLGVLLAHHCSLETSQDPDNNDKHCHDLLLVQRHPNLSPAHHCHEITLAEDPMLILICHQLTIVIEVPQLKNQCYSPQFSLPGIDVDVMISYFGMIVGVLTFKLAES